MIELTQVSKRYGFKKALHDVSLIIPKGKVIGLIGENGSGKSTMLKLIAGLLQPTRGQITLKGERVTRRMCTELAYLSEQESYYPFYTVKEHLKFYKSQFFDSNEEKAEEILTFMNIDREAKVQHLSKGNRSRFKMVLSLARKVPVILMDEPFSGLDPMAKERIMEGLLSFIDLSSQTVVIATHEVKEMEPLLDSVILMKDGKLLHMEQVEEIKSEYGFGLVEWMKHTTESKDP